MKRNFMISKGNIGERKITFLNAILISAALSSLALVCAVLLISQNVIAAHWIALLMATFVSLLVVVNRRSLSEQNPLFPEWPRWQRERLVLIGPIVWIALAAWQLSRGYLER